MYGPTWMNNIWQLGPGVPHMAHKSSFRAPWNTIPGNTIWLTLIHLWLSSQELWKVHLGPHSMWWMHLARVSWTALPSNQLNILWDKQRAIKIDPNQTKSTKINTYQPIWTKINQDSPKFTKISWDQPRQTKIILDQQRSIKTTMIDRSTKISKFYWPKLVYMIWVDF